MALLELADVSKTYPGTRALASVDLTVGGGEVHAILGQNGAGKSTLMKVIAGSVTPDQGGMTVAGRPVPAGSPEAARAAGIAMVYQELSLVPSLSVGENVLLGRLPTRWGTVDWRALWPAARHRLDRVGLDTDPRRRVQGMGTAERQLVEIAKALAGEVRVLVLDEPTSALSDPEARRLFQIIRDLAAGGVAVLYVSHRLREVLEISDRVTVLRDGRRVATVDAAEVDEAQLARMMVGAHVPTGSGRRRGPGGRDGEVLLRADGLARPPRLKPVDLELRAGEVVAVFGLVGSGRTRLARTLFGLEPATGGRVEVAGGRERPGSPAAAIASGIGYVGEDRTAGLVPRLGVAANITLASLSRLRRGIVLDRSAERRLGERYLRELAIKAAPTGPVAALSGGNQQKVMLARWLCSGARVLVLDDPTRGIDVGAKQEVFRLVREFAAGGGAVLYLTSEVGEARDLADRLLIMAGGRVVAAVAPDAPEDEIMTAAGGVHV